MLRFAPNGLHSHGLLLVAGKAHAYFPRRKMPRAPSVRGTLLRTGGYRAGDCFGRDVPHMREQQKCCNSTIRYRPRGNGA